MSSKNWHPPSLSRGPLRTLICRLALKPDLTNMYKSRVTQFSKHIHDPPWFLHMSLLTRAFPCPHRRAQSRRCKKSGRHNVFVPLGASSICHITEHPYATPFHPPSLSIRDHDPPKCRHTTLTRCRESQRLLACQSSCQQIQRPHTDKRRSSCNTTRTSATITFHPVHAMTLNTH